MLKRIFSLICFMGMVACSQSTEQIAVQPLGRADIQTTPALRAEPCAETDSFAVQLFSVLAAAQQGNIVFSPASLENVLRLLQQGARGSSAAELAALPMGKQGVRSAMNPAEASALFISEQLTLKPGVQADDVLKAPFATAPHQAAKLINDWSARRTRGLIPSIVSAQDLPPTTALVAANAIYLKEKWLHPFPVRDTRENAVFTQEDGNTIRVAMMHSKAKYRYAEGANWSAVAIPYKTEGRAGEPGYFIGILPKHSPRDYSARDLARDLTPQQYRHICKALADSTPQETIVNLPRFELKPCTFSLKPALQACGLTTIFSQSADFSGFVDRPLYLDDVLQRCYCKADEEGTTAAAVTVAVGRYKSIPVGPRPNVISFNKPFIWIIGDLNTPAAPYFMGITNEP